MRFHVDRETQANVSRGMSSGAARRAARLTFGSVDSAHELSRDDRPGAAIRQTWHDARFGARLLAKSPAFGLTGIAIVALGVGAATAIFSVVYGVMLQPLPYREPERVVTIWLQRQESSRLYPSAADVTELRQLRGVFADVAMVRAANLNLVGDGEPRRLQGARISSKLFTILGVSASLGRTFANDADQPGHDHVVLLSDPLWRGRFAGDPGIVGRQLPIDGAMYTVVGVMPPDFQSPAYFRGATNIEAWVPIVVDPRELTREQTNNYLVVARLAPGATVDRARRETAALAKRIAITNGWKDGPGFTVDGMLDDAVRDVRPALNLLLAAVSFLLLIACVNLSNLFGARATARRGEFAVRLALGASRARLIAQAIAEAAPVLVIGGALGVLLSRAVVAGFVSAAPPGLPRVDGIQMSGPVIAFSLTVLVLTGIAASIAPAIQAASSDFTAATKDGGRGSTAGRAHASARRVGVAAQIAFALPLLVGASLLIQSALAVGRVDLGFNPDRVATWSFEVSRAKHVTDKEVGDYYVQLIDAVRAVPGVANAAIVNRIPLAGAQTNGVRFERAGGKNDEEINVDSRTITPDYFATLGIRLLAGRIFKEHDDASAPLVGIVDERAARTMWPGETALGKRFRGPNDTWVTVVGVVGHVHATGVEVDPRPQIYWSARQWAQNRAVLVVRSTTDLRALFAPVTKAIRSVDPEQSVFDVRTMPEVVDRSLAQRHLTTLLMVGFGGIALLLAAVGIYGVIAYGVSHRLREFGIRVALGATRGDVTQLVVREGASMAIAGAAVGLVLALAGAGVMSTLVFGVAPRDLVSVVGSTALLVLVALLASYIPARRAAGVDPGITLRSE